jgi:hypothetical protein
MCDRWELYAAMKRGLHDKSESSVIAVENIMELLAKNNPEELVEGVSEFYRSLWHDYRIRI